MAVQAITRYLQGRASNEITLEAGDVLITTPSGGGPGDGLAWSCHPEAGGTVAVEVAIASHPLEGDFINHGENSEITDSGAANVETAPLSHMKFTASNAGAKIHLLSRSPVMLQFDGELNSALTVLGYPDTRATVGELLAIDPGQSIQYRRDGARYSIVSSDTDVATAESYHHGFRIMPVAAGESEITITAHVPYGATASDTFTLTVIEPAAPVKK